MKTTASSTSLSVCGTAQTGKCQTERERKGEKIDKVKYILKQKGGAGVCWCVSAYSDSLNALPPQAQDNKINCTDKLSRHQINPSVLSSSLLTSRYLSRPLPPPSLLLSVIMTGAYNSFFRMFDRETGRGVTLEAWRESSKPRAVLRTRRVYTGGKRRRGDVGVDSLDFTKKILHMAWHPSENIIAIAATNNLYIFQDRVNPDTQWRGMGAWTESSTVTQRYVEGVEKVWGGGRPLWKVCPKSLSQVVLQQTGMQHLFGLIKD